MGLFLLTIGLLKVIGRLMPVESFCSIVRVRTDIVTVLLLFATLASGFALQQLLIACAALIVLGFMSLGSGVTAFLTSDDEVPRGFSFSTGLAPRAPPLS